MLAVGGKDPDEACPKLDVAIKMSMTMQMGFTVFLLPEGPCAPVRSGQPDCLFAK